MMMDVTKFLALTAAMAAGTALATACTVTEDADGENTTGGTASGGTHHAVGEGGENAGGASTGGSATEGGAVTVQGGAAQAGAATAGAATAGASTAGAATAGAATAGAATAGAATAGASTAGASTAGAATAGAGVSAGGAAGGGAIEPECYGDDPSFELDCSTAPVTDCDPANEDALNPIYDGCVMAYGTSAYYAYRSGIAAAIAQCVAGITDDECSDEAATQAAACQTEAVANACENPLAIEACGTEPLADEFGDVGPGLLTSCPELTEEACLEGLRSYNSMTWTVMCMDPAGEFFDPDFTGDCVARFADCLDK